MQLRAVPNVCASQQTVELDTATLQLPRPRWTSATSPTSPCPCFRTLPCHSRRERGANSSIDGDDGPPGDCYEGHDPRGCRHGHATGIDFSTPEDDDVVIASGGDSMVVPEANSGEGEAFTPIDWDLDLAECGDDYCVVHYCTRSTNPRRRCVHAAGLRLRVRPSSGDLDRLVGRNDSVVESLANVV